MSGLSSFPTWIFPITVFATSVVASSHCAGMCGPLIMVLGKNKNRLASYHFGRMISYVGLGFLAGKFGSTIFKFSNQPIISTGFLIILAITLLTIGVKTYRGETLHLSLFGSKLYRNTNNFNHFPIVASGVAGLSNVFLPCGHLYAFALGATTSGSALNGGLMMFAFWAGTLPALALGVQVLKKCFTKFGPNAHRFVALIFVITGLLNLLLFAKHINFHETKAATAVEIQTECADH